jgi:magnesium transporter
MPSGTPRRHNRSIEVVLGTATLGSLFPSGTGIATGLVELGAIAFLTAGVAERTLGIEAPWFVLVAVVVGLALRAADLESCALFIPAGLYGLTKDAFGRPVARVAAGALFLEQVVGGALAASVAGHYVAALGGAALGGLPSPRAIASEDPATLVAAAMVGFVWWWHREGRPISRHLIARTAGTVGLLLAVLTLWSLATAVFRGGSQSIFAAAPFHLPVAFADRVSWLPDVVQAPVAWLAALGSCFFVLGSVEALTHIAPELPPPTIRHLGRTARLVGLFSLWVVAGTAFLFVATVPAAALGAWFEAPIAGLTQALASPVWLRLWLFLAVTSAAVLFLAVAVHRSASGAQQVVARLTEDGVLHPALRAAHPRLGTPSRLVDLVAATQLGIVVVSAGQTTWLARVYGMGLACAAVLKVAALVRQRRIRPEARAFSVPLAIQSGGRRRPIGLWLLAASVAMPALALAATGDLASLVGAALVAGCGIALTASERRVTARAASSGSIERFEFLSAPSVGLDQVQVRPGGILVAVRRPHFLAHLRTALRSAGDRDIVVMTVRLMGVDVPEEQASEPQATEAEQRLLAEVVAVSERSGRAVRLLVVPAASVPEAVVETVLRLRSAEVHVGESETLPAAEQARLLGDAWERVPKPEPFDVRLTVHHSSGRTVSFHLGAHAPALTPDDLGRIHALWLDVVKAVGPHVHHHDIVRAALTLMEHELSTNGPERDRALEIVRRVARPADELAEAVKQRDFARVRDTVRNRPPSDLAGLLTDLSIEEQVVIFRVLPRKMAAATFEYLTQEDQEALIRAMAQEDVAGLLNNMAPDDRTMFLEELPASVTQQMLALLSPEERAVAVTLLGYPDGSIGRLMTPDYVSVREHWTVQEVLDHVRTHGQDSETLNVIYVVDEHGVLVDDIRIRELLLTSPSTPVSELMDRRFVALKAADDQTSAVALFRSADRSALPVVDSAGVLIGIVTIDDVIDVAEAAATKEIQKIGGSEALDEPYMEIGFGRMIQKRAGWLTALFLGEMLTATAMGAFEKEIERAVVLALFVPLIISSGGNSGSQASTLVIRAIALGEVTIRDWWRVMRREVAAGLALGGILGAIGFTRIAVWSAFSTLYGPHWLLVALTVGLSLVGVVLWGTLTGSLLPFLLRRMGFDPATSSAPFVATLVDVTGLVIYFSLGLLILRGTLL